MTDGYEAIYRRRIGEAGGSATDDSAAEGVDDDAPRALKPLNGELRAAGRAS
jgi:hypothetical protein